MGNPNKLEWTEKTRTAVYETPVFSVRSLQSVSPEGMEKRFTTLKAPDWGIIIPVIEKGSKKQFVMVRQWRHGTGSISIEFPGGVIDPGEDPAEGARRELLEETGYRAETVIALGSMSPNPAIMENRVHFYAAVNPEPTGRCDPDDDEYVAVDLKDQDEVYRCMGHEPYVHSLMCAALFMYRQYTERQ